MDRYTYKRLVEEDARRRADRAKERGLSAPYDPKKMVVRIPFGCVLWMFFLAGGLAWVIYHFFKN